MQHSKALLLVLLAALSFTACKKDKDPEETCKDKIAGEWKTTKVVMDGQDITDGGEIVLELSADGTGEITITVNGQGSSSYDIESWSVNNDCSEFEFEDEDGDTGEFELKSVSGDELVLEGRLYNDENVELEFEKN